MMIPGGRSPGGEKSQEKDTGRRSCGRRCQESSPEEVLEGWVLGGGSLGGDILGRCDKRRRSWGKMILWGKVLVAECQGRKGRGRGDPRGRGYWGGWSWEEDARGRCSSRGGFRGAVTGKTSCGGRDHHLKVLNKLLCVSLRTQAQVRGPADQHCSVSAQVVKVKYLAL